MILVWNAVELDHRSRLPDRTTKPLSNETLKRLTRLLLAVGMVVIVTGTIVTGSGPHSGAEREQILEALENQEETAAISTLEVEVERLPFDVPDVARIHGISVMVFLLLTLRLLFFIKRNFSTLRKTLFRLLQTEPHGRFDEPHQRGCFQSTHVRGPSANV